MSINFCLIICPLKLTNQFKCKSILPYDNGLLHINIGIKQWEWQADPWANIRKTLSILCVYTYTHSLPVSQIHKITFQKTFCSNINLGHGRPAKSHTGVLSTSHTHCFQTPWPEMTGLICPTGRVISLRICVWEMRRAHPLISLPFPDPKDWQI